MLERTGNEGRWSRKAGSRLIQSNYIGKNIGRDETGSHKTGSRLIQGVAKAVSTVHLISTSILWGMENCAPQTKMFLRKIYVCFFF